MSTRPVWAEISCRRLLANYRKLCQAVSSRAGLLPIVKANAYGHDVSLCAPLLAEAGATWLGVTGAEEGVQVRSLCPESRVLLMSGIWAGEAEAVIEHKLTPVVWEPYHLDLLEEAAIRKRMPPASLPVHLEIDTGMSRQGVRTVDSSGSLPALLERFHSRSSLRLEGVMTHFSSASSPARENPQLQSFAAALERIVAAGHHPEWIHAGNSSTAICMLDREKLIGMAAAAGSRLMIRPGLGLYGYLDRVACRIACPVAYKEKPESQPAGDTVPALEPVLAWKTRVTSLRTLRAGEGAGYDHTFISSRATRLALLPAGYADGISRLLSNRGHVLVRGERAPIAGRVSMDQTMVDVTDIPGVSIGDEVVLLGSQGMQSISAWEIADHTGSIAWEVLCAIAARVPRIAVE